MDVTILGRGEPDVAVVGAVHGDEPCGARAIERVCSSDLTLEQAAKFIVVNDWALEQNVRYIDTDLNRVLPGDLHADTHEDRLAARLSQEVEGCFTLGIHSTQSYDEPFGVLANPTEQKREVFRRMTTTQVVDTTGLSEGRCVDQPAFVDVEVGPQGTQQAVDQAENCICSFLRAMGVLSGDAPATTTDYYRVTEIEEKDGGSTYEFLSRNFTKIEAGDVYARRDGQNIVADEPFWPILASGEGHENILGYRGCLIGEL